MMRFTSATMAMATALYPYEPVDAECFGDPLAVRTSITNVAGATTASQASFDPETGIFEIDQHKNVVNQLAFGLQPGQGFAVEDDGKIVAVGDAGRLPLGTVVDDTTEEAFCGNYGLFEVVSSDGDSTELTLPQGLPLFKALPTGTVSLTYTDRDGVVHEDATEVPSEYTELDAWTVVTIATIEVGGKIPHLLSTRISFSVGATVAEMGAESPVVLKLAIVTLAYGLSSSSSDGTFTIYVKPHDGYTVMSTTVDVFHNDAEDNSVVQPGRFIGTLSNVAAWTTELSVSMLPDSVEDGEHVVYEVTANVRDDENNFTEVLRRIAEPAVVPADKSDIFSPRYQLVMVGDGPMIGNSIEKYSFNIDQEAVAFARTHLGDDADLRVQKGVIGIHHVDAEGAVGDVVVEELIVDGPSAFGCVLLPLGINECSVSAMHEAAVDAFAEAGHKIDESMRAAIAVRADVLYTTTAARNRDMSTISLTSVFVADFGTGIISKQPRIPMTPTGIAAGAVVEFGGDSGDMTGDVSDVGSGNFGSEGEEDNSNGVPGVDGEENIGNGVAGVDGNDGSGDNVGSDGGSNGNSKTVDPEKGESKEGLIIGLSVGIGAMFGFLAAIALGFINKERFGSTKSETPPNTQEVEGGRAQSRGVTEGEPTAQRLNFTNTPAPALSNNDTNDTSS